MQIKNNIVSMVLHYKDAFFNFFWMVGVRDEQNFPATAECTENPAEKGL